LNTDQTLFLKKRFGEARHKISLYLEEVLSVDLLEQLGKCLKREVACDIFVSKRGLEKAESDAFLLIHLLKLRKLGAYIYLSEKGKSSNKILCFIDYEIIYVLKKGHEGFVEFYSIDKEFDEYHNHFTLIEPEYRLEPDDITIEFLIESNTVYERTATKIFWEVTNATHVTIDGIGEVAYSGQKTITFLNDTILKLKATHGNQKKLKSVQVKTISEFKIRYGVQFRNPSSNEFVSMDESKYKGVFGIAKGYDVRLTWEVAHADTVNVKPFGFYENKGSHIFNSDGSIEINIEAKFRGKSKNQKILIYSFPTAVFERKFINLNPNILKVLEINIDDVRINALEYIRGNDDNQFRDYMDEMDNKYRSLKSTLLQKLKETDFNEFYEQHSIPKLFKKRKSILLNYFKSDPKIVDNIESTQDYYE
tara:strand:- start:1412 stop:2674 length:1263 start_codon:yes stop_codon:yes gene_type:complete